MPFSQKFQHLMILRPEIFSSTLTVSQDLRDRQMQVLDLISLGAQIKKSNWC